jgi:hypothetical protein
MKTQMQPTSLQSYLTLPEPETRQKELYDFFKTHPKLKFTDRNLAHNLKKPINCIVARRNELVKQGKIEKAGILYDSQTKRHVNTWRLKS